MGEKITLQEYVEIDVLPLDTICFLKVDGAPRIETVKGKRGDWDKVSFRFKIEGFQAMGDQSHPSNWEELVGKNIFGSIAARLTNHPDNKLKQWLEALLGMELGVGFELDLDYLDGRQCRGVTGQYTKQNGEKRHQVESLLPRGTAQPLYYGAEPGAQPAQQAAADPWATGPASGGGYTAPASDPWASPAAPPPPQAPVQTPVQTQPQQPAPQRPAPQQPPAPAADPWADPWAGAAAFDQEPPY